MRPKRARAGQVVFLEFAGTLPIFCILFVAMTMFHRYYTGSRHAYAQARLGVDVFLDNHHSDLRPPRVAPPATPEGTEKIERARTRDELSELAPAVTHLKAIVWEYRTGRRVASSGWWGTPMTAAGFHRSGRDNWSHYDIDRQIAQDSQTNLPQNKPAESMRFIFYSPGKGALEKEFLRL